MSKCKSCGAEIRFLEMPSGRKMPVEFSEKMVIAKIDGELKAFSANIPHWANCPNADKHRKPKIAKQEVGPLTERG